MSLLRENAVPLANKSVLKMWRSSHLHVPGVALLLVLTAAPLSSAQTGERKVIADAGGGPVWEGQLRASYK